MKDIQVLLEQSAAMHRHLCPRQVLGVRIGMYAGEILILDLPQTEKRLYTIAETDGCAVDGISVATNCWVGRRTLRIEDYGKVAATFVDTLTGTAVRIAPRSGIRQAALNYAPEAKNKWQGQLLGYQRMPAEELLSIQWVQLNRPIEEIISKPGKQAFCDVCGEEIMNDREIIVGDTVFCKACAGQVYYHQAGQELPAGISLLVNHAGRH